MIYECYDKNGKYLGYTHSKAEADEKLARANVEIMRREGASPIQVGMYIVEQKRKQEERAKRSKLVAKIWIALIIFAILINIIAAASK